MRSKRESTIFEEKNFISEDETVQTQAACLNRIFRKVNSTGLSADTIQELRYDIDYVAERYHTDNQGAVLLADKYAFSGGNIENIARKSTVEYVLSGNEPTLSSLVGYCQEEILDKKENRNRIGF